MEGGREMELFLKLIFSTYHENQEMEFVTLRQ